MTYNTNFSSKLTKHLDYIDIAIIIGRYNDISTRLIAEETETNIKLIDQRTRRMQRVGMLDEFNKPQGVYKDIAIAFAAINETTVYLANVLVLQRSIAYSTSS